IPGEADRTGPGPCLPHGVSSRPGVVGETVSLVGKAAPTEGRCGLVVNSGPSRRLLRKSGRRFLAEQGRRDSNAQPVVLETSALPIELRPYRRSCQLPVPSSQSEEDGQLIGRGSPVGVDSG